MKYGKIIKYLTLALGIAGTALAMGLVFILPVWLLWNWLMPAIFGLGRITVWQAYGLLILSHIMFKNSRSDK